MSLTLQCNNSGAWKSVGEFDDGRLPEVVDHAADLSLIFGSSPRWRIVVIINGYPHVKVDDAAIRSRQQAG